MAIKGLGRRDYVSTGKFDKLFFSPISRVENNEVGDTEISIGPRVYQRINIQVLREQWRVRKWPSLVDHVKEVERNRDELITAFTFPHYVDELLLGVKPGSNAE